MSKDELSVELPLFSQKPKIFPIHQTNQRQTTIPGNYIAFVFSKSILMSEGPLPYPIPIHLGADGGWFGVFVTHHFFDVTGCNLADLALDARTMQLKTDRYGDFWYCLNCPNCKGTLSSL